MQGEKQKQGPKWISGAVAGRRKISISRKTTTVDDPLQMSETFPCYLHTLGGDSVRGRRTEKRGGLNSPRTDDQCRDIEIGRRKRDSPQAQKIDDRAINPKPSVKVEKSNKKKPPGSCIASKTRTGREGKGRAGKRG